MSTQFKQWGWLWILALAAGGMPVLSWAAVSSMPAWQAQPPGSKAIRPAKPGWIGG